PTIPVIDIHCHPALKMYLFAGRIEREHRPGSDGLIGNVTDMHVDLPSLAKGNVCGVVSVLHLPERGIIDYTGNILFKLVLTANAGKIEAKRKGEAPFRQTMDMMDLIEDRIDRVRDDGHEVLIARSAVEFEARFLAGKTTFIHSIEGAHSLGTGTQHELLQRLDRFIDRGLAQFTIAHFFENEITGSGGGIPPHMKEEMKYHGPGPSLGGLNQLDGKGEALVMRMLERGVVLDLTHCTVKARQEIYAINKNMGAPGKPKRPLVFSHTGLRNLVDPGMDANDQLCLPDEAEVKEVNATGGVIGIIFMNYWLNGIEEDDPHRFDGAIDLVVQTALELKRIAGNCKHIAIGTDLDGFSQTPDDLTTEAAMPKLFAALHAAGFSDDELMDIGHRNYLRVLRNAWGPIAA
ncbi:MAG: membrane dipeptidase, partial [Flavobacteriales bacterium]|nr:membrane dipeptidase [Flavobacteriales bacterium]